jgi:BASS family bile acid:Na+ symporter
MMIFKAYAANFLEYGQKYGSTLGLLAAIIAGILLPQAARFSPLIQYSVFGMMFLAFIGLRFEHTALQSRLLLVLVINIFIALMAYFVLQPIDGTLALAGFMIGISPTALSSSIVADLLQMRVDYTVAAVMLTNVSIAVIVPFLLPILAGNQVEASVLIVLWSVTKIVIIPLILARLVHYLPSSAQKPFFQAKRYTFILWATTLFIIVANASQYIRVNAAIPTAFLGQIAFIAFILCLFNFGIGALIGGSEFRRETSQILGHKNLSFTIWLATTFLNPVVALGPTFYIIFHNSYNSFLIYKFTQKKQK